MKDISVRSYLMAGVALSAASAIAFTPLVVPEASPRAISVPQVATPHIDLAAVVTPADIEALLTNLGAASDSMPATVGSLAGMPGQTLVGALNSAAAVSNALWDRVIAATNNRSLVDVLKALKAASNGGLTRLAASAESANDTITLTSGQLTALLTSTLTGSLATAQHAVATLITNPLSVSSYTGLVSVPLDLAGLALNSGIAAARHLGVNGIDLGNTMVHAVTAQITNIVAAVDQLTSRGVTGAPLFDGVLTAVQALASLPVTVGVAGVNGLTDTVTEAGSIAWTRITNGAAAAVTTWLGDGADPGALQTAIDRIGAGGALSPAAYTDALSVLVGAGITTARIASGTVKSMASIPFSGAADLTTTAANMIKEFNRRLASAAAGIVEAAGLPSLVYNLPHFLAAGVNTAITLAAVTTSAALNGVAGAIDSGNTLTGAMPKQQTRTLSVASDSASLTGDTTAAQLVSTPQPAANPSETDATDTKPGTDHDPAPTKLDVLEAAHPDVAPSDEETAVTPADEVDTEQAAFDGAGECGGVGSALRRRRTVVRGRDIGVDSRAPATKSHGDYWRGVQQGRCIGGRRD